MDSTNKPVDNEKAEALATLRELRKQIKPLPADFDYKEELCKYLDERFCNNQEQQ